MIIILEGADGTGKTTLATKLMARMGGANIYRRATPREHVLREYTFDRITRDPIIADRWHYGELIYGPLFRTETQLTTTFFRAIDQYLRQIGALLVLVDGQAAEIRQRILGRAENDDIDELMMGDMLPRVLDQYREIYEWPQEVRKMRIMGPAEDHHVDEIIKHARRAYAARHIKYD